MATEKAGAPPKKRDFVFLVVIAIAFLVAAISFFFHEVNTLTAISTWIMAFLWVCAVVRFGNRNDEGAKAKRYRHFLDALIIILTLLALFLTTRARTLGQPRSIDSEAAAKMKEILHGVARNDRPHVLLGYRRGFADESSAGFAESLNEVLSSAGWDMEIQPQIWTPSSSERDMDGVCFMAEGGPGARMDERQEAVVEALGLIEGPCMYFVPESGGSKLNAGTVVIGRRSTKSRAPSSCFHVKESCLETTRTPAPATR
jgi:hypothetical protein